MSAARRAAVLLLAVAGVLLLIAPAPLGHVVSSIDLLRVAAPFSDVTRVENYQLTDAAQVFQPDLTWARETLLDGHLPLWNPDVFAGWPLFASQQTALLHPITLATLPLPAADAATLRMTLLLLLAVFGGWFYGRTAGLSRWPAALTGIAFGFGAYLVAWLTHPHSNVYALVPLVFALVERGARGERLAAPALAAMIGVGLLGGHPQSVFVLALFAVPWAAGAVLRRRRHGDAGAAALRLGGAGVLGGLAGAVVALPLLELLGAASTTERGGFTGARLEALWSLALPEAWGRPDRGFSADPQGLANYLNRTAAIGAVPLLLALGGLTARRDLRRWGLVAVAALAVVLAYDVPGLSSWVVGLPGIERAAMTEALIVLSFALAALAGLGLQALLDAGHRERLRAAVVMAGAAAVPLVWLLANFRLAGGLGDVPGYLRGDPVPADAAAAFSALRWGLAAVAAIGLVALAARRPAWAGGAAAALAVVALLDLGAGGRGFLPVVSRGDATLPERASLTAARTLAGPHGRFAGGGPTGGTPAMIPNGGQYEGLRDVRGRGVPVVSRYLEAWGALGGYGAENFAFFDPAVPGAHRALDAFGVRALLTAPEGPAPASGRLRAAYRGPDAVVYDNAGALPRAFVARSWRGAADRATAGALLAATTSTAALARAPVVEGEPARTGAAPPAPARITRDEPGRVTVDVRGSGPGMLVLLDAFYPGWTARVNGREVPIRAANVAFRAVPLPAGAREVAFTYEPASVRWGALVSLLAWLGIGGWAWRARRAQP